MNFRQAANTVIQFGKNKGKTIDQVGESDDGLLYLDWLSGIDLKPDFKIALDTYLSDPTIARDLDTLVSNGRKYRQ